MCKLGKSTSSRLVLNELLLIWRAQEPGLPSHTYFEVIALVEIRNRQCNILVLLNDSWEVIPQLTNPPGKMQCCKKICFNLFHKSGQTELPPAIGKTNQLNPPTSATKTKQNKTTSEPNILSTVAPSPTHTQVSSATGGKVYKTVESSVSPHSSSALLEKTALTLDGQTSCACFSSLSSRRNWSNTDLYWLLHRMLI